MDYLDSFDVDPKGNIYIYSGEPLLKFDNKGHYVQTFVCKGQEPGEYLCKVLMYFNRRSLFRLDLETEKWKKVY